MAKVTFKNGDRVIRIEHGYANVVKGEQYIVDKHEGDNLYLKGISGAYTARSFMQATTFQLKNQPWFIAINGKEHSRIAQEWLFEQGVQWEHMGKKVSYTEQAVLTNVDGSGIIRDYIMHANSVKFKIDQGAQEIKVHGHLKMVLDKVELPEVESEQAKKIRELEDTIQKAQKQIDELKQAL